MSTIVQTVTILENIQTNVTARWGVVMVYQDNTTNTFVEVYDAANVSRLTYAWIDANTKLLPVTLGPGDFTIRYSGSSFPITVLEGSKQLINSHINTVVSRLAITASVPRINASEQTNLTVTVDDKNFDYENITFNWTPNVGTMSGVDSWNRFTREFQYSSTVTYNAPAVLQKMFIDILVTDDYGGNFTYRIYVSEQQGTVYVNSTAFNGLPKADTFIEIYNSITGIRFSYGWANATGWVKFVNVWEDEYYLKATEGNAQFAPIFLLDVSQPNYFHFKWGLLSINSTGLNRGLIDTPIYVYNQSTSLFYTSGSTLITGNGYKTFYLAEGDYKVEGRERNSIWKNMTVISHQNTTYEYQFGVFAIYYLDDNGDPQSKFVEVFNGTSGDPRLFYDWTSTSGFVVFIVAPFDNYTIKVEHNGTFTYYYYFQSIAPNEGKNVGQFVNHIPSITAYSASPSIINPTENTTITITAVDPDPLDVLTYIYEPSVGTIIGSGYQVVYEAPSSPDFYYLNISVVDPHGAFDNLTRSLSARTGSINISVIDFQDLAINSAFVELFDWTTGGRYTYGWTNVGGQVIFNNVPENFYYLKASVSNAMYTDIFISPANSQYDYTFKFGALFVNSTAGNDVLIATAVSVLTLGTSTVETSGTTTITDSGQIRFNLRPDSYDIRGTERNYLYFMDVQVLDNQFTNLTFQWAELNVTARAAFGMPLGSFIEIYNASTNIRVTYDWPPVQTGQVTFYVAPSNDYQVRVQEHNIFIQNTTAPTNQITSIDANFGNLRVTSVDINGDPQSVSITVLNQTTSATITSLGTGSDGVAIFFLYPGIYQVTNTTYTFNSVIINPLQRTDLGPALNHIPSLVSVTASPTRIGPDSSTWVTVQVTDIDYDYDTMNVLFSLSTGTLGIPQTGWIQKDIWYYQIEYFSPSTSELYQLNLTIDDGAGGNVTFMLIVSDRTGTLNLFSQGNLLRNIQTSFWIYRHSTGQQVASGSSLLTTGLYAVVLEEDFYYILGREHNDWWAYQVWVLGGEVVNITFLWGELTIFSSGVGGVPLQGTFVEVFDQDTGVRYTYDWTNVEGKSSFILKPGTYRITLTETNTITFDNIIVVGGSTLILGSEVPTVTKPDDIIYELGTTGHSISWTLNDVNPNYYNVTLNGMTSLMNDTLWIDGTIVTVSIDGLSVGTHYVIIMMNDTLGYEQYDLVWITVLPPGPTIDSPNDLAFIFGSTGFYINWTASDNSPNSFTVLRNGTEVASGVWESNIPINISIGALPLGVYNYTIIATDTDGLSSSDTVFVTVTDEPVGPIINSPQDISYVEGDTGYSISWIATDDNPNNFTILYEGIDIANGSWVSGNVIIQLVDDLLIGVYNYTIIISDYDGFTVFDTVIVTVTAPEPPVFVSTPNDLTLGAGTTGTSLSWVVTDSNPATYELFINSVLNESGTWNSGIAISYSLDGLTPGTYNFTLIVTNNYNLNGIDSVIVTITSQPSINSPQDISYVEGDTGFSISWIAIDNNPSTYSIQLNGNEIASGSWVSGNTFIQSVDGLSTGVYNYTIIVSDEDGFNEFDSVIVTVTAPESPVFTTTPFDLTFVAGTTGYSLSWVATDRNASTYEIMRDSVTIESGTWESGTAISMSLDELAPGIYNFTLVVTNDYGLILSDSVLVTITSPPIIPTVVIDITSPEDLHLFTNATNIDLTWDVTYSNAIGVSWTFFINSVVNQTGIISNNTALNFDITSLDLVPGSHNLTIQITVQDFADNFVFASDEVGVHITHIDIIPVGTTQIDMGGETETTIVIEVEAEVEITIEPVGSSEQLFSEDAGTAFQALVESNTAVETGIFFEIDISDHTALDNFWINISYADWDLEAMGIDEDNLKIITYNEVTGEWEDAGNTGVDTLRKVIYANVDHFSAFSAVAAIPDDFTSIPTSSEPDTRTITGSETTSTTETSKPIPGFEIFSILMIILCLSVVISRRRNK
ncbi:MAG: Heimdall-CTERM domain-containing surface protein [Candidatus Hodarchaeales archaeon]